MMKIDKPILVKAVGVTLLGWLALPIIYYILLRQKGSVKEPDEKEEETKEQ